MYTTVYMYTITWQHLCCTPPNTWQQTCDIFQHTLYYIYIYIYIYPVVSKKKCPLTKDRPPPNFDPIFCIGSKINGMSAHSGVSLLPYALCMSEVSNTSLKDIYYKGFLHRRM